jgi:hypothetical protein
MNSRRTPGWISFVLFCVFSSATLFGQTTCEEGNGLLNSAQPAGITLEEIIQKFAAKEALFKQARDNYIYTQDVTVQTVEGNTVDGEFREVTDITYDDKGARLEHVTFAPQSSLVRLGMTKEDLDDVRHRVAFVFTTDELPQYNILYAGTQHVDEIDTYVFDAAPKRIEKGKRYFQGRIWVDNHDLQIVKTCGKSVPDVSAAGSKKKHVDENLSPRFVTYREQIDGQFWFPTYTRADEDLHFRDGDIHIREIIKYTNYKRFGVKSRIIFKGEVPPTPPPQPKPQPPK